jgi:predicted enzyme related to lactoylglutathione lyase
MDPERQRAFYSELFNWDIGEGPIMDIPAGIGGPEPGPAGHIQPGANPGLSLYVQVGNVHSTIDKAIALGGKETIPPFDLENGQTLAAIEDPEGNFVMLVQQ